MARFKPLSLGSLPRVMVAILAMDHADRQMVGFAFREVRDSPDLLRDMTFENMAEQFHTILHLPKDRRTAYVGAMNYALDGLKQEDAFGTEGQLDPRGDDR